MATSPQEVSQCNEDSAPLPDILKRKKDLIIENDLCFDPACCGAGLFISDENTSLKKNVERSQWMTCRIMNDGWNQGVHYWSMRIMDRGMSGLMMIGIVSSNFNTSSDQFPGYTGNSYGFYVANGTKYRSAAPSAFVSDKPQTNDVIGVLLDLEARTLTYFKNGQILGTAFGELSLQGNIKYYPAIGLYELGGWVNLIKTIK